MTTTFGDITLMFKAADLTAKLPCEIKEQTSISIIILDEMGRTRLQKDLTLPSGEHEVELPLKEFGTGNYNAWVYLDDQTFIRSFSVNGEKASGLFGGLFRIFN